ncbi:MAG: 4-(cytidine 5'-diphospho)-2-C-methyl-D-erythritol kinase [Burkholderiaceae bacterium]
MKPPAFLHGCPAPAKLNLYLHITGRRADGYHELETVFELIDLADHLDFRRRDDGRIEMPVPLPGIDPERELCLRAARLLAQASGTRAGVDIAVRKRIPMGAGLGGGSSDAATTLLALNRLWNLGWPAQRLAELGLRLGADVPVFIHGLPAYGTGIGDRLEPIDTEGVPTRHYLVVMPPVEVPTAVVFQDPALTRNSKPLKIFGLSRGLEVFRGRNDLEAVVCGRFPAVAAALEALREAASDIDPARAGLARMSGTGASVFMPVVDDEQGRRIRSRVSSRDVGEAVVVRSLDRHPLRDRSFPADGASRPAAGAC